MYTYIYIHCYKNYNLESVKICIAPAGDDNLYCLNSKSNTLLITNKLPDANNAKTSHVSTANVVVLYTLNL